MNAKRTKVILKNKAGWGMEYNLALTTDQIKLLDWLLDQDVIDCEWERTILEEATVWKEI